MEDCNISYCSDINVLFGEHRTIPKLFDNILNCNDGFMSDSFSEEPFTQVSTVFTVAVDLSEEHY